jgi:predicted nucleic acid-binding protein
MKKLVDTCGWIEWLTNGKLVEEFEKHLKDPSALIIPSLLQFELYKWVVKEKNMSTALEVIGITENGTVVPLDTSLALYAADLSQEHDLAMADAIIYATSLVHEAVLVTSDKHFKKLPNVKYIEKSSKAQVN